METKLYTFMDLFSGDVETKDGTVRIEKIVIPKIQRDYAQGRRGFEIDRVRSRFLDSLYKALTETPITLDFIYGNIEKGELTPLDGQQRLTTLYLLHWYAGKKENIPQEEMDFLKRFSYETRYSARDFCSSLVDYQPSFEKELSKDIINQAWFPLEWLKDQTIASMLVMLDDIDLKFRNIEDIWGLLKNKRITFYILPLKDMELTDELYIKMNSRGKPLTQFEHFKAELEKTLTEIDSVAADRIIRKIDIAWSDMLWEYRGDNNITDDEFLHYFKYVCDMICYKEGGTPQGRLPDQDDRELVGRAANLNDDQIRELARLQRGVAAVYQNEWIEPILCKVQKSDPLSEVSNNYDATIQDPMENMEIQRYVNSCVYDPEYIARESDYNFLDCIEKINCQGSVKALLIDFYNTPLKQAQKIWQKLAFKYFNISKCLENLGNSASQEEWQTRLKEQLSHFEFLEKDIVEDANRFYRFAQLMTLESMIWLANSKIDQPEKSLQLKSYLYEFKDSFLGR